MGSREFSFQASDPCKISLHSKIGVTTAWIVWGNICVPASSFFSFLFFKSFVSFHFFSPLPFSLFFFLFFLVEAVFSSSIPIPVREDSLERSCHP